MFWFCSRLRPLFLLLLLLRLLRLRLFLRLFMVSHTRTNSTTAGVVAQVQRRQIAARRETHEIARGNLQLRASVRGRINSVAHGNNTNDRGI